MTTTTFQLAIEWLKQTGWTVEARHGRTLHYRYATECGKQRITPYWEYEVAFRAYRNGKEWHGHELISMSQFSDEGGWYWAKTEREMWRIVVKDRLFWVLYPNSEYTEFQPLQWFERKVNLPYQLERIEHGKYRLTLAGRVSEGTLAEVVLKALVGEVQTA